MNNKSPFEIINSFSLSVVSILNKFLGLNRLNKKLKFILCYHSIGDSGWRFSTPVSDFEEQVQFLSENFRVKSLTETLSSDDGAVVITFDDGYKDVYVNAFPVLKKYGMTGTIFVLGDNTCANRYEMENSLEFMSDDEIKHLKKEGWIIGSHSNTHANFHKLSKKNLVYEINQSKLNLEKKLGFEISIFAYPKGKYNDQIIDIVKKAGYSHAFTVDSGFFSLKNNMKITRLPMEGVVGINQFSAMLSYLGLLVESVFMEVLKIKERYLKV